MPLCCSYLFNYYFFFLSMLPVLAAAPDSFYIFFHPTFYILYSIRCISTAYYLLSFPTHYIHIYYILYVSSTVTLCVFTYVFSIILYVIYLFTFLKISCPRCSSRQLFAITFSIFPRNLLVYTIPATV